MMRTREEIKLQAKACYRSDMGTSIGAYIVFALVCGVLSGATGGVAAFILMPVLMIGYNFMLSRMYLGGKGNIGDIFTQAFTNFGRKLGGYLWMMLFTFLWSLLFYIPGIVKALAYSMTPYILANEPNVKAKDALKLSMRMTQGYKAEIFVFYLSFIGWGLLSALTCGILELVFVGPYRQLSMAGLYWELRANAVANGVITEEEFAGVTGEGSPF